MRMWKILWHLSVLIGHYVSAIQHRHQQTLAPEHIVALRAGVLKNQCCCIHRHTLVKYLVYPAFCYNN